MSESVVSVPMPAFKLEVFHATGGLEIVTSKVPADPKAQPNAKAPEPQTVLQLRQARDVTNENVSFVLTTGAGSYMRPKKNEKGEFEFDRGVLKLKQHKTPDGDVEFFGGTLGAFTNTSTKGIRQWACAHMNPILLVEAACENKPLEIGGLAYVPSGKSETSPVLCRFTPLESNEWIVSAQAWMDANADTVANVKSKTLNAEKVAEELETYKRVRKQRTYDIMGSRYGKLNDPVNINEVNTAIDTCSYTTKSDPRQALGILNAFNGKEVQRKYSIMLGRTAVQVVAEVCASCKPIGAQGQQCITTPELVQFLRIHTTPVVGSQQSERKCLGKQLINVEREKVFRDVIDQCHVLTTALEDDLHVYENDENYLFDGKTVKSRMVNAEKMDLAGGPPGNHWDQLQARWTQLNNNKHALLSEQARLQREEGEKYISLLTKHVQQHRVAGEAQNSTLKSLGEELNQTNQEMLKILMLSYFGPRDCEDGSWAMIVGMNTLQNNSDSLYEEIKPFVAKSFLPMENMFPLGNVDKGFESENSKVEAIHFIVRASLQLTSEALKWQATPVKGTRYSYESCFGLAAAPSLNEQDPSEIQKKTLITREQCSSWENFVVKLVQGDASEREGTIDKPQKQLAGHCFTVLASRTPVKTFKDGTTVEKVEIRAKDLLESTVANAFFDETKAKTDERLGNKNISMSVGGENISLFGVSHSKAREVIGEGIEKTMRVKVAGDLREIRPVNMGKGMVFYKLYSQIGGKQAVSAEITDKKNVTSLINSDAAAKALISRTANVAFCTSAIAWDGIPTPSHTTKCLTIDVPLAEEEKRRIEQIAYELTPLHTMTKEHLAFLMNDMGTVVNVGFHDGKFHATDFTGERLDSETRIAHSFVVTLTEHAMSLPKYWTNKNGINAVIQSEMQAALPGLGVRVSQIQTGVHIMQVTVES